MKVIKMLFFALISLFVMTLTSCLEDDIPTPPKKEINLTDVHLNIDARTYVYIDETGKQTTVNVIIEDGAIQIDNRTYTPITVLSPVYVDASSNDMIIVHGDRIWNVINVDARSFVNVAGDTTNVQVHFADGAIVVNNNVYVELDNGWYFNQELNLWIDNSNSNVITQSVRIPMNIAQNQTNIVNRDSCTACMVSPCIGDTIYFEVGTVPFGIRPMYEADTLGFGNDSPVNLFSVNAIDATGYDLTYFSFLASDALVAINLQAQNGSIYSATGVEPYTTSLFNLDVDVVSQSGNFTLNDPIGSQTSNEERFRWSYSVGSLSANAPLFLKRPLTANSNSLKYFRVRYGYTSTSMAALLRAIPLDVPSRWHELTDIGVAGKDVTIRFDDGTSATGQ